MFNPVSTRPAFATDFGDYPVGGDLTSYGWSQDDIGPMTFTVPVEADTAGLSGKRTRINTTNTNGVQEDCNASWDLVGSQANVEILALFNPVITVANDPGSRLLTRNSQAGQSYLLELARVSGRELVLLESTSYTGSGATNKVTNNFTDNTKQWMRIRVNGTTVQGRWWADGDAEPSSWQVSFTDSTLTTGKVGFGEARRSAVWNTYFYWFSVGLNGATAPGPTG